MNNLKTTIETRIETIKTSEATTKENLPIISRDLLLYVPESGDIGMVNRLIEALTPRNRMYAALFFQNFLPWTRDEEKSTDDLFVFAKKSTNKDVVAKKLGRIEPFLKSETNNIWTWTKENTTSPRVIDYGNGVKNALERALDKDKGKMSQAEVARLILSIIPVNVIERVAEANAKPKAPAKAKAVAKKQPVKA